MKRTIVLDEWGWMKGRGAEVAAGAKDAWLWRTWLWRGRSLHLAVSRKPRLRPESHASCLLHQWPLAQFPFEPNCTQIGSLCTQILNSYVIESPPESVGRILFANKFPAPGLGDKAARNTSGRFHSESIQPAV